MLLKNQKILITGIGKGIGKDIFLKAMKEGAYVVGITRSKIDIKKILKETKGNYKIFYGNLSNYTTIDKVFKFLLTNKIKLTGLVNNAGIRQRKKFLDITEKDLNNIIKTNLISPFLITQKFYNNCDKKKIAQLLISDLL